MTPPVRAHSHRQEKTKICESPPRLHRHKNARKPRIVSRPNSANRSPATVPYKVHLISKSVLNRIGIALGANAAPIGRICSSTSKAHARSLASNPGKSRPISRINGKARTNEIFANRTCSNLRGVSKNHARSSHKGIKRTTPGRYPATHGASARNIRATSGRQ